jgi:hypothetical protein
VTRGTVPIVTCDHEDGCDQWMLDHWTMGVTNWQTFLDGWKYDPHQYDEIRRPALCPDHNPDAPPCGHVVIKRGCGGCDPSAIEYVIVDGDETRRWRPFDAARDLRGPTR